MLSYPFFDCIRYRERQQRGYGIPYLFKLGTFAPSKFEPVRKRL